MSLIVRKLILAVILVTGGALAATPTAVQACERYGCDRHYSYRCYHSYRHHRGCCHCGPSYYGHGHGYGYGHGYGSCRTYVSWAPFWPFGHRHHHRGYYRGCY